MYVVYDSLFNFIYSAFHKTLPKSSLKIHWISVRFYAMGDSFNLIDICGPSKTIINKWNPSQLKK